MSNRQIGLKVKLSGGVVKSRILKLEQGNIIIKYVLKIEPPVLGRGVFFVAVSGRNTEMITKQIKLVGDPFVVAPCIGGIAVCGIAVEGNVQEKIRLARELMHDMRVLTIFKAHTPALQSKITKTDFMIIKELMADPKRSIESVAVATRFSSKTITRSIKKLRKENLVQFTATYDPTKMHPYIPHVVLAGLDDSPTKIVQELKKSLGEKFLQNPFLTSNQIVLFLHSKSIYGLDELTRAVRESKGIVAADLFIPKIIFLPQDWMGKVIRKNIESS